MKTEINYGGYTANGSDYGSADGELAAVMGLINEEGQLRPVDAPKMLVKFDLETQGNEPYEVKYIHKTGAYEHLIVTHRCQGHRGYGTDVYWIDRNYVDEQESGLEINADNFNTYMHSVCRVDDINTGSQLFENKFFGVNAVGNTLVLLFRYGMHYCLWSGDGYKYLGDHLPELPLSFGLQGEYKISDEFSLRQMASTEPGDDQTVDLTENDASGATGAVLAEVNSFIAKYTTGDITTPGKFIFPFFVRYAYRLFDGSSLTMHSSPVLMVTQTDMTPNAFVSRYEDEIPGIPGKKADCNIESLVFDLDYICLDAHAKDTLNQWSDIVQSVDVFVSAPIYTYMQSGNITQWAKTLNTELGYTVSFSQRTIPFVENIYKDYYAKQDSYSLPSATQRFHFLLPRYSDDAVKEQIKSCSNFYFLKSIQLGDIAIDNRVVIDIPKDYLPTLTSREVMTDDYDSHDQLIPGCSYVYNSRLSLAALTKQLAAPLHPNVYKPYEDGSRKVRVYFFIKQDQKEYVVSTPEMQIGAGDGAAFQAFRYLYYPDGNAYKALVVHERNNPPGQYVTIVEIPLKRHDFLNGACFFDGWEPTGQTGVIPTLSTDMTVQMNNKVYTSEVNNPFIFPVSGIATVGNGEVLGMAAAVKAISQNEFGREPMYVFTTEGVWAMQVTSEGGLEPAKLVTLDVCSDPKSITNLDNTVLFATDRGIMMLGGTESLCITDTLLAEEEFDIGTLSRLSEVLSSDIPVDVAPFKEYLSGCRLLYDYKRQRIVVFNPSYTYAYIYSLKSKLWGMMPSNLSDVVDGYPDTLAMTRQSGNVTELVMLCDNPGNEYSGLVVTRPLKLGDGNAYKSIHTLVQRGKFIKGHVKTLLYASRDLWNWYLVASSNGHWIRGLRGTGYLWYRVVLLTELEKGESLSGATVEFEVKQAGKIH